MKPILGKILQKKDEEGSKKNEAMLALSISAGIVKATVWELRDHTVEILGLGTKVYSDSGKEKGIDYKNLLEKAADAIDLACQVAETDVKKTIFGFPQSWIVENELLPEYDNLINKLAKELDLEAVAYVSIPHAISYYLQYLHKAAPTALLIGTSREGATISYVETGKVKESTNVAWLGGSFGKNIDTGLLKFKTLTEFPPLLCLYGFGDLTAARNDLTAYNWKASDRLGSSQKAPNFVSSPKIMILEEHVDSLAVSLVGGKDLAKQMGVVGKLDIKSFEYQSFNSDALVPVSEAIPAVLTETVGAAATQSILEETANDGTALPFGFVMHEDSSKEEVEAQLPTQHEEFITRDSEEPGYEPVHEEFVADDSEHEIHTQTPFTASAYAQDDTTEEEFGPEDSDEETPWNHPTSLRERLAFPKMAGSARKAIALIIAVVILLAVGGSVIGWALWNLPKATVTVYVKPDNLEKQVSMTAKEGALLSTADDTVPAKVISVDIQSTKKVDTTGKSAKGTTANGTVTIYNKTDTPKTFSAGTELKTSDNKTFKTAENVTVASASADISGKVNGKADVKVNAADIGPDGNISKDVSFTVSGLPKSDFEGVSASAFTGGTKKDIQTVAAVDKTTAARQAKDDIASQVQDKIKDKVSSDEILLDKAWQVTKTVDKYDKNTGDEASSLTVEETQSIDAYVFKKSDVDQVLSNVSSAAVPDGYELKDNNKQTRTEFVSLSKDGTLSFNAVIQATIIPKIDEQSIAHSIIGKKEDAATQTIKSNPKVFDVSYDYSMHLPDLLNTLPHLEKNITVKRAVR